MNEKKEKKDKMKEKYNNFFSIDAVRRRTPLYFSNISWHF